MTPRSFEFPGSAYPAGRPSFFALHYQSRLWREGVMSKYRLKPVAMLLLMKVVLEEDRNRYGRPASLFNDDLARDLACSEDTVQRARDSLVKVGLLHYERAGDRRAALYWVKELPYWETFSRPAEAQSTRSYAKGEHLTGRMVADATADQTADVSADATADPYIPIETYTQTPSPRAPDGWEEVVRKLQTAGLVLATEAAADARRNGFSAELALACVDWYLQQDDREALGPGVLLHRFRRAEATQYPPGEGWPKPNPEVLLRRTREREAARADEVRRQQAELHAKQASSSADRQSQREQLLLQFGDEIDRLSPDERVELLRDKPVLVQMLNRCRQQWRSEALVRFALCEAMAAKHASN